MISKDKQYRTRDGREVRIYATDGQGVYSVHGAIKEPYGEWRLSSWNYQGRHEGNFAQRDLIEIRPRIKREVWLNVFNNGNIIVADTPKYADITHRIACVKVVIDCEEGEGL